MYEFGCAGVLLLLTGYLILLRRWGSAIDWAGAAVTGFGTVVLGASMLVYVPAGPLVPALHSYWLVIHGRGAGPIAVEVGDCRDDGERIRGEVGVDHWHDVVGALHLGKHDVVCAPELGSENLVPDGSVVEQFDVVGQGDARAPFAHDVLGRMPGAFGEELQEVAEHDVLPVGGRDERSVGVLGHDVVTVAERQESPPSVVCADVAGMANNKAYVEYPPLGVIGVIGPWNFPVFTPMGSIAYALAAGNAVVFKPSEYTPGVGVWLAESFAAANPEYADVFQVVTGLGETGAALCRSGVDKLAFTGSTRTGKRVMATEPSRTFALQVPHAPPRQA